VIEITNLDAVIEQHAIPLPVEAVGEQNMTLGSFRDDTQRRSVNFLRCADSITEFQIDLIGVWLR